MGTPDYNQFQTGKFAMYVTPVGTGVLTPSNITPVIDFPTLVSLGLISGYVHNSKIGTSVNIPTSTVLLSNLTSSTFPINFPASPQQMQIVSSSANDTAAGTGAQQIKLTYLRSPASLQGFTVNTEFITTNGTNPVLTVNTDIYRIEKIEVSQVGSELFADGFIYIQSVGGATSFERIGPGTSISRTCVHFVPKGFKSILLSVTKGASTSAGTIFIVTETFQFQGNNVVNHAISQTEMGNFALHSNLNPPHVIINTNGLEMYFAVFVQGVSSNQAASATIHFIDAPI